MKISFFTIFKWFALIILVAISCIIVGLCFYLIKDFFHIIPLYITLAVILLVIWGCIWSLNVIKNKTLLIVFASTTLITGAAVLVNYCYDRYIDSIPTLSDQGVNLREYQPFDKNTKAVKLSEVSTLRLTDSLPLIDGATALYPLYAAFVQATYPEKEYPVNKSEVGCGTTPKAYNNLIDGKVDLIFCAKPSDAQIVQAANKGKTFRLIPIGREAFVFFVNKENPVKELTIQQIKDIYSGKITNWKDAGGRNDDIKAYQRPKNSGSQTMLEHIMGNTPLAKPLETEMAGGMGDIITYTADYKNYKNAIGYSFLFFATEMAGNNQIELLKVDGIYPSRETVKSGQYPFTGDFYAITTDTQNPNVQRLIDWILSPQGQYLVEQTGYTPIQ
ncbi:phosphate transport system substrate-binding protein [Dysgonomonas sp. PFB1-18]|uniref:PstS family phosphate ABC transporter substrate-binding protein n=1 Tax=unclassified Dysgonomonas TaxID=2630389 RepID=UPI0024756F90|nr:MULTISPECIES: substrate-binding domain-containing protein [unclassified Dysgonomonas]MDH6309587.1 phosphate transport system substrate-binding protein [Dysgonomonas sp. PF1-14]MDH6339085.1 phosphate transport system substrate-binding protein [Dysgonomonas sp. PF1-16]MDH6380629.1 phosphate transport system substrate-binding protein [Dysgonomonas sp. PFB1-18]MDH6398125.1 phosphate transport system substrate-binding protein [Dysgonomonas sp. PF1-23]